MATQAANKRVGCFLILDRRHEVLTQSQLTREYANLQKSPPPYITAHPSEANILEYGDRSHVLDQS
jgi:ubiquitin-conjugating enzyme E2 J2